MIRKTFLLALIFSIWGCAPNTVEKQTGFPEGQWIDLSYAFDENTIYWPTASSFRLDTVFEGTTDSGFWVVALPMKIKGGSGGPLRIVALKP